MGKLLQGFCIIGVFLWLLFAQPGAMAGKPEPIVPADSTQVEKALQTVITLAETMPDSAEHILSRIHQQVAAHHDTAGMIRYYHTMTYLQNNKSQFEEALESARRENELARLYNNPLLLAKSFNALANTYEYLGVMDSAGKYFLAGLQLADSIHDKGLQRRLNNNLSSILYYTGDYAKGLRYARSGYVLAKELADTNAIITSLLNVGGLESGLKQYDSSREAFEAAISLTRLTHDDIHRMDALNNLGELLSDMGRHREALEKYREMLALSHTFGNADYRMYAEGNIGNTLAKLARYREAEPHLAKAILIADTIHAANEMQQWLQFMASLQQLQGNYREAFRYLEKYQGLKDSLMNVHTRQNIHRLEIQYETAQKDRRLALQQLDIAHQQASIRRKNTWILGSVAGLITLSLLLLLSRYNYRNKKKLHSQTVLSLQKEQEVVRLKALMEGKDTERRRIAGEIHDDIGSGLTTILFLSNHIAGSNSAENKAAANKIARNANLLIERMKEIIWSMNTDYDTLDDLVAYIRQHAGELLEDAGIRYHFYFPYHIPPVDIPGEQRRNIYLAVKEALHNIVKHAQATEVTIRLTCNREVHIAIRDNGKGFEEQEENRFGNGLKNMKRRMETVGGSIAVQSGHGTTIQLSMPLPG